MKVSEQLVGEIMAMLAAEGLALGGKEDAIKAKLSDALSTPLISLKNTAYTSGALRPVPLIESRNRLEVA
jgi:hypothetical protein